MTVLSADELLSLVLVQLAVATTAPAFRRAAAQIAVSPVADAGSHLRAILFEAFEILVGGLGAGRGRSTHCTRNELLSLSLNRCRNHHDLWLL